MTTKKMADKPANQTPKQNEKTTVNELEKLRKENEQLKQRIAQAKPQDLEKIIEEAKRKQELIKDLNFFHSEIKNLDKSLKDYDEAEADELNRLYRISFNRESRYGEKEKLFSVTNPDILKKMLLELRKYMLAKIHNIEETIKEQ